MLTRDQLRRLHGAGLPLHILEQDYIQALFLKELYLRTENVVFKGGTYLRHAFGLDRYSEDLDFTIYGDFDPERVLKDTAEDLVPYGIEANISRIKEGASSIEGLLRYKGPLFDGTEESIGAIHIEVSTREDILLDPIWTRMFFEYPEVRVVNVLGLRKEEAFSEKLRALGMRNKGRDLYDVWFLLEQGTDIKKSVFEEKMNLLGYDATVPIRVSEEEWNKDLAVLLRHPPDYEGVLNDVLARLNREGFNVWKE